MKLEDRRMKRARLVRDGLSWRQACLQAGYSLSVANKGPRGYSGADGHNRLGLLKDFERAAEEAVWKPDQLKKIVTHRLATAVIEGKASMVAREAELIGRMREVDLFVRNADVQVGIWGILSTPEASQTLDVEARTLDAHKE
jgi:hypothetical protein